MGKIVYVEKFENRPGIYIIFNRRTHKIYIGKAKRMKERVLNHVKNLFWDKPDNANLQKDFNSRDDNYYCGCLQIIDNEEELDRWERIYYWRTCELYGRGKMYNIQKLPQIEISGKEKEEIDEVIKHALRRKTKGLEPYSISKLTKGGCRDWIPEEVLNELGIKTRSIKEMFENHEIDFLMFGKAGDYIGKNRPDTISETLKKKIEELNKADNEENRRCLWATSGPEISSFKRWLSLYNNEYGGDKKVYVLFKLTVNKFDQNDEKKEKVLYAFYKGKKYEDTAPCKDNTYKKKALVIKNFYAIKEDFRFEDLQDLYYKFDKARQYGSTKRYILNKNYFPQLSLYPAVLNSMILDDKNTRLRKELGFLDAPYLLDELRRERKISKSSFDFPECNKDDHPIYYLLAEVEDFIEISSEDPNSN